MLHYASGREVKCFSWHECVSINHAFICELCVDSGIDALTDTENRRIKFYYERSLETGGCL